MFLTYRCAKIAPFGIFEDGPTAWSYVEHNIHRPWFYVAAAELGEDFDLHPMLMLSDDQLLRSLVDDQEGQLRMESVLLVTPDHINQSGRWMMEPLESIVRFESAKGVAYAYQVLGERTYIYGNEEVAALEESRRETLFSTSMLASTRP